MKKYQSGFTAIEVLIVIVIIGAIAGVGFMIMGKSKKTTDNPTANKTQNTGTTTAESGTCFGVSKATIKSLLGDGAANLQNLSDTGVKDIGKGDKAQTCVYTFEAGATATNSFMMDLGTYANQANLDASQKYITDTGGAVTGVGESATYSAKDVDLSNSRDFVLTVRQDLKIYKFEISQPQDKLTFNDATAQSALIKIAQAATL